MKKDELENPGKAILTEKGKKMIQPRLRGWHQDLLHFATDFPYTSKIPREMHRPYPRTI